MKEGDCTRGTSCFNDVNLLRKPENGTLACFVFFGKSGGLVLPSLEDHRPLSL